MKKSILPRHLACLILMCERDGFSPEWLGGWGGERSCRGKRLTLGLVHEPLVYMGRGSTQIRLLDECGSLFVALKKRWLLHGRSVNLPCDAMSGCDQPAGCDDGRSAKLLTHGRLQRHHPRKLARIGRNTSDDPVDSAGRAATRS
jgi:hypothetical protein